MPTHAPLTWSEKLQENTGVDLLDLFKEISPTAESYRDAWRKVTGILRQRQAQTEIDLERSQLGEAVTFFERKAKEANAYLIALGINIQSPIDRSFKKACALGKGVTEDTLSDSDVKEFIQDLYDKNLSAAATIRAVIEILAKERSPENDFLIDQLSKIRSVDSARFFSNRGYKLEDRATVCERTHFSGDTVEAQRARRVRIRTLEKLSPMRREQESIRLADMRSFPYAGRRKDIVDLNGHHPFITSIYAANLARRLTRANRPWLYRPTAIMIKVPATESIPQRTIKFEPEFYLPDENLYIKTLTDRRHSTKQPGSLEEREDWLEAVRRLRPDLNIVVMYSNELEDDGEILYVSVKDGKKTRKEPGHNIQTDPDSFLLAEDACPCSSCRRTYANRKAII